MITNESWMLLAEEYANEWSDLLTVIRSYIIAKTSEKIEGNFGAWLSHQRNISLEVKKGIIAKIMANRKRFNDMMARIVAVAQDSIAISIKEQSSLLANKPLIDNLKIKKDIETALSNMTNECYMLLLNSSYDSWKKSTENMAFKQVKDDYKVFSDAIKNNMLNLKDAIGVVYKNGRKVSFKTYIEMATRTNLQNVALNNLLDASRGLGIIFHLCTFFNDSAPDHAKWQGKTYVLENWKNYITDEEEIKRIEEFIKKEDIRTLEWVIDKPVYMTTRPNCRHSFIAIDLEQAINYRQTLKDLNLKKGTYKADNYEALQKQRYNERKIRQLKEEMSDCRALVNNCKVFNQNELKIKIMSLKKRLKIYQTRNRILVDKYPQLRRQYQRENAKKLAFDLGVSINQ